MYKVKDNVRKFYNKLTSRTIEITDDKVKYIYQTSNGSEWELQNRELENDIYKRIFRKEELQDLLNDREATVNVI